jgi:DNA-binding transcriptional ArsR family regulator
MSDAMEVGDPRLESTVRILAASVNARILAHLIEARRADPEGGWRFLSKIAEAVGEKPGTVSMAIQKLLPLLEERREKGKRYFRSQLRSLELHLERF